MTSRSHSDVELILVPSHSGGSLTQGKEEAESTVFNSDLPEAYYTTQRERAEYNSHKVKNPENSVSNGTPNGAGDDPLYEIVPSKMSVGSVMVGGSEGGGVIARSVPPDPPASLPPSRQRLEENNVFYKDKAVTTETAMLAPDLLKHRSLRGSNQKSKKAASYITFRCRTKSLKSLVAALVLAVASLALTTLLWFGVYDASPSPSSPLPSPTPKQCDCPCESTNVCDPLYSLKMEGQPQSMTEQKPTAITNMTSGVYT